MSAGACVRPGERVRRSSGPDTDTAAMTRPDGPRTGRRHGGDARFAFADGLGPATAAYAGEDAGIEPCTVEPHAQSIGVLPRHQHLCGRSGLHRHHRTDGHRVAQPRGPIGGCNADALIALSAIQLRALACGFAQSREHGSGRGQQSILARGGGELAATRAEDETALQIAADQPVMLEGDGQAVGSGPGEPGGGHQSGERSAVRTRVRPAPGPPCREPRRR